MLKKDSLSKRILGSFQGAIFVSFIFSMIGSVLNYVFQIVVGNMVSLEEFGWYNSINSLATNISIVFSPLSVMACQITAANGEKEEKKSDVYVQILVIASVFFICVLFGGIVLFQLVQGKFGIAGLEQWVIILFMIGISGVYMIMLSVLQGMEKFVVYGMIGTLLIIAKLGICILNLRHGTGVNGIVWAMLLSYLCMIIVMCLFFRKKIKLRRNGERKYLAKKEIFQLYGTTFVVQILVSFYINGGEIILMDYLFDDKQVGLYSSAIMLGKICLYIVSMVSVVLLPKVAKQTSQDSDTQGLFYKTVGLSIIMSIAYSVFLMVGGKQIIPLLFGQKYNMALEYINSVVVFTIPLSTLSIVHHYFLGIGKIKAYAIVLGCVTGTAIGIIAGFVRDIKLVPVILGAGLYAILIWAIVYVKMYSVKKT